MELRSKFDYTQVQFDKATTAHLLVSATAPKVAITDERKPLTLLALFDESGSMRGAKIDYCRKTLSKMIEHLTAKDRLGVIAFTNDARTLFPLTAIADSSVKSQLKAKVAELRDLSATNISAALQLAYTQAKEVDGPVHIMLLTDGDPTAGVTDFNQLCQMVEKRPKNVTISTYGYGDDCRQEFLARMADVGRGNFTYVKNPDDVLTAFARELGGLLSCTAQNLEFKILPKANVKITNTLSDVDAEELDGGALSVKVVDLYSEETRHLVFEIEAGPVPTVFPRETSLFDIELSYDDPFDPGNRKTVTSVAKLSFVKDVEAKPKLDQEVVDQVAICKILRAQIEAEAFANRGDYATSGSILRGATMDSYVAEASAAVMDFANATQAHFADSSSYEASRGHLTSNKMSFKKGRSSGGDSDALYASTSFKDAMVKNFTQPGDNSSPLVLPDGVSVDPSALSKKKEEEKKSLSRRRSSRDW